MQRQFWLAAQHLRAGVALACGDKLVALGGGVGFDRVIVSRNPGHIILMLEPSTGLAAANDKLQPGRIAVTRRSRSFRREERCGNCTLIGSPPHPDLILVDAGRAEEIQPQPVADKKDPVILPVAYAPIQRADSQGTRGGLRGGHRGQQGHGTC